MLQKTPTEAEGRDGICRCRRCRHDPFCVLDAKNADPQTADGMAAPLSKFTFGDLLPLRVRSGTASPWLFAPAPVASQTVAGDRATYTFRELPKMLAVPFVTITGEIACDSTGMTPSERKAGAERLSSTAEIPRIALSRLFAPWAYLRGRSQAGCLAPASTSGRMS